ncbi:hypothetical protein E3N88_33120 [Mikania micrantha]|uniref:Uncharacterized protein n=1 Tax=Mikania micrantha TaxID=192012 RepID=A0A5N6MAI9_9ASTR|nr:hypothetical protein E3N88_33120 [Mikania micrantha]
MPGYQEDMTPKEEGSKSGRAQAPRTPSTIYRGARHSAKGAHSFHLGSHLYSHLRLYIISDLPVTDPDVGAWSHHMTRHHTCPDLDPSTLAPTVGPEIFNIHNSLVPFVVDMKRNMWFAHPRNRTPVAWIAGLLY